MRSLQWQVPTMNKNVTEAPPFIKFTKDTTILLI